MNLPKALLSNLSTWRPLSARAVLWILLGLLVCGPLYGRGGIAVEGVDRARLLAPAGARVSNYTNVGYHLQWVDDEVHIEVEASPLISSSPFLLPEAPETEGSQEDPMARLARGLTVGVDTHYDAISRILGWVAREIEYDLDRDQNQEAVAVLERRSGYCTGIARLTVSLLRAVGIEAREVAGYVVGGGLSTPSGYHRWIEAYLPDRGWVFSDPLRSHHYVPANYLRLASEELALSRGTEGLLLERRDAVETVDLYPQAVPGITARRNWERQLAAALRIQIADQSHGVAELTGGSLRRLHTLIDGKTTFVGLAPGSYQLRLLLPDRPAVERAIELKGRVRQILSLPPVPTPEHRSSRPAPGLYPADPAGTRTGVRAP